MITKKTKLFFFGVALLLLAVGLFWFFKSNKSLDILGGTDSATFKPEFLTVEEKKSFKLEPDAKIQVISRDANGKITVYRVINSNEDIVNPEDISSVR